MKCFSCVLLVMLIAGIKADTLTSYGRLGGAGGRHGGGGGHSSGGEAGHSNDLGQYSGVLPPVTLGGGGRGGAGTAVQSQYTPGGKSGVEEAAADDYFGTADADYYEDYEDGAGAEAGAGDGARDGGATADYDGGAGEGSLEDSIPGVPGTDYPIYAQIPETGFTCDDKVAGGYYADTEGECQVFHICAGGAGGELIKFNFLCPNGTIFNQEFFICDWWFNFDCAEAEDFYSKNDDNAAEAAAVVEARTAAEEEGAGNGGQDQGIGGPAGNQDGGRGNQNNYGAPGGRRGGNGGDNGAPRRRPTPSSNEGGRRAPPTGYGPPGGADEGLPPLASYATRT